jgi:uncharacterized membrane protein
MGDVLLGVILLLVVGGWIITRLARSAARNAALAGEQQIARLTTRLYTLEQDRAKLDTLSVRVATVEQQLLAPREPAQARPPEPVPVAVAPKVSEPVPPAQPPPLPVSPAVPEPEAAPAPPAFQAAPSAPALSESWKSILNLEATLGANWLNKLGVIVLVLGIAFFLAYQLQTLGPAGKVLVGYFVSVAMLGGGVFLERRERYRIFARATVGGGWALTFFTTYAMYHVPAAQVLNSQALDLVLMLIVSAAMVAHTLRYRSQVVTGLAFLLAFCTVTISHVSVYSLAASAVLALGLVAIVLPMRWYEMELFGIVATFGNHFWWLRAIIEPMGEHHRPFPEFFASAGLLAFYWVVFRTSYLVRRVETERAENVSTIAALLNSLLLLALMKYQSIYPELAFWFLFGFGALEMALGYTRPARRRRAAFVTLSTLGTVLLVAVIPFRYSGSRLSVLWLAETEALFFAGVRLPEILFRRLGAAAALATAIQMIARDAVPLYDFRIHHANAAGDLRLALVFAVAAIAFYADAHWVPRRWPRLIGTDFERVSLTVISWVAAVMAFIGVWAGWPGLWTAVAWAALALALGMAGRRWTISTVLIQANLLAAAAFIRVLVANLGATPAWHHITLRLITVSIVAALLYVFSRWSNVPGVEELRNIAPVHAWAASFLVALVAWYEFQSAGVALAWTLFGLILFELGFTRRSLSLRLQAYVALGASFLRVFFVNLNALGPQGELAPRIWTTVPVALAFYYIYWRLTTSDGEFLAADRKLRAAAIHCFLGTFTAAGIVRFGLAADWVAAGWAILVTALVAVTIKTGRRVFLHHSLLLTFGVVFRAILHNFYQRSYFPAPFWQSRVICVGAAVAALFAAIFLGRELRTEAASSRNKWYVRLVAAVNRRPDQAFFFAAFLLLTVLIGAEARPGLLALAWGAEAVVVFLFALRMGERSFRLSGLALLLLSVGKIVFIDVWRLNPRDRYLTLIGLGCALLLTSFFYTRHRETIQRYL